ncbi:sulfotransferase 1C2-like [Clavelina lepadiformis]|uniref:sulfotransferase 1C2-like n=1 Tax=Clavelina lepadiformis TaxID=159417 RepID=UPI004042813B
MQADPKAKRILDVLGKLFNDVANYIPADDRPDVTPLIEDLVKALQAPSVSDWKGHKFAPPFKAETVEWQYNNWQPSEKDVLVASFPKTGTTWMSQIVKHIIYKDNEETLKMAKVLTANNTYLESGTPLNYEVMEKLPWERKIWGTHNPANLINMNRLMENKCKIIYVMRNPKDQFVSWYNMCMTFPHRKAEAMAKLYPSDWNDFFQVYINGKQPMSDKEGEWYPDHILSWYPYRDQENVLFVMYEDLKKNPATEIGKIAKFVGVNRSDTEIDEIVEATSFESMKRDASNIHNQLSFFRKGQVGSWKNHFTVAQSELMDQKFREKISGTDITFTYE